EYQEQQRELVETIKAHPAELKQVVALLAQVAKLTAEPEDSPVVERLAEEIGRLYRENVLLAGLAELVLAPEFTPDMWNELMDRAGGGPLAPAHRRLIALVTRQLSAASTIE